MTTAVSAPGSNSNAPSLMGEYPLGSAASQRLQVCHVCETVVELSRHTCPLCHAKLHLRQPLSLQRCMAYLITACLLYIPANVLPIMETVNFGRVEHSTIVGGVVQLWAHGSYLIAMIIFTASVVVPVFKILVISWLCWSVGRRRRYNPKQLTRLYVFTEFIGKWSMVDVFVVALLVALVDLGGLIAVHPGTAALAFAGVVIFTMLSAQSFDSRLIWDNANHHE